MIKHDQGKDILLSKGIFSKKSMVLKNNVLYVTSKANNMDFNGAEILLRPRLLVTYTYLLGNSIGIFPCPVDKEIIDDTETGIS